MTRSEFVGRLRQLEMTASPASVMRLVKSLLELAPRVDAELRGDLSRELLRRGVGTPVPRAAPLGVGEAYLLLFEAPASGHAVRMHLERGDDAADPDLGREVRRAYRGAVATAARSCRRMDHPHFPSVAFDAPFQIEGGSIGLAVAIASLSHAAREAPRSDTAGSAQVDERGELRPVAHLPVKLEALRRCWPEITRVVVARAQTFPEGYVTPTGLEVLRARTVEEALPLFGVSLVSLHASSIEAYVVRIASFAGENGLSTPWTQLALEARECAEALVDQQDQRAKALLWAAIFSLHAGDADDTEELLSAIPDAELEGYPALLAHKLVITASREIDAGAIVAAIDHARAATALCQTSDRQTQKDLLGKALGTHGRALMHRGDYAEAEPLLRAGLAHHDQHKLPAESVRSACYLATCLRLSLRLHEAHAVADEALARASTLSAKYDALVMTRQFLRLERARIASALERWEDAERDFALVKCGQENAGAWPRLGGTRGLAHTLGMLGRVDESLAALAECVEVARNGAVPQILRKIAATAAGDALLAIDDSSRTSPSHVTRANLEQAWREAFGLEPDKPVIERTLRGWVY